VTSYDDKPQKKKVVHALTEKSEVILIGMSVYLLRPPEEHSYKYR
jgi:hypothetical protein